MECGFEYHVIDKIPPLSWCAVLSKENKADIFCGNGVECAQQSFVEGAWNGKYERKEIEKATFLCGSGCVLKQNAKNRGGTALCLPAMFWKK